MTSLLLRHVYTERSQLVQYFTHYFTTCQVLNVIASYLQVPEKMNAFSNDTCLNVKHQPFIFQHIVQIYLNTHWYMPVRPYERRDCCDRWISRWNNTSARSFSSTTLSRPQANCLHQTCIAGLVKHLSPYTGRISAWMVFGQRIFAQRKWITERCSLRDAFSCSVAKFIVYKWHHSDVIVIKFTAVIQN